MNEKIGPARAWLWFTVPIAVLLTVASAGGVFIKDLYRDKPFFVAQATGQDLVSLAVVLPMLIVSAILAGRGSARAWLVWLGGLVYLLYTYVFGAFDVRFNSFFLVYVGLMGCSLYALIGSLATANLRGVKEGFTEATPVRTVSIYFAVVVVLFYFLWLSELVPALVMGEIPQSVRANGTATNAVHVLDMAWILPAFGIAAVNLWRKKPLGYTLAGALLSYSALLVLAILSMAAALFRTGSPVSIPQVALFGTLFAISIGMLTWYLKSLSSVHSRAS